MEEKQNKKDPKAILLTGNDGKVFWAKDTSSSALGSITCGICEAEKPFQECRWEEHLKKYICSGCRKD